MDIKLVYGQDEVQQAVEVVKKALEAYRIITFTGELGAGKTTLIRALLRYLGVQETITSPTFSYVNVYRVGDKTVYHFDLYRIASLETFFEQGFDEFLHDENSIVLIEWPDVITDLLQQLPVCAVQLDYAPKENKRILKIYSL